MADRANEVELWRTWKKDPSNENLRPLLKSLDPLIIQQVNKVRPGNLPKSAVKAQAVQLVIDGLHNYDPDKAQLNTHLTWRLKKLNRYVYEHQNLGTIPEPRIIQIGTYNKVKSNLSEQLGRDPSSAELADELKWSKKQVDLLEKEMRKDLIQDQTYTNVSDEYTSDVDEALYMLHSELYGQDKQVMEYLYGLEGKPQLTNTEIANKLGISQSMVTQIKNKLASRLRQSGVLKGY